MGWLGKPVCLLLDFWRSGYFGKYRHNSTLRDLLLRLGQYSHHHIDLRSNHLERNRYGQRIRGPPLRAVLFEYRRYDSTGGSTSRTYRVSTPPYCSHSRSSTSMPRAPGSGAFATQGRQSCRSVWSDGRTIRCGGRASARVHGVRGLEEWARVRRDHRGALREQAGPHGPTRPGGSDNAHGGATCKCRRGTPQ